MLHRVDGAHRGYADATDSRHILDWGYLDQRLVDDFLAHQHNF